MSSNYASNSRPSSKIHGRKKAPTSSNLKQSKQGLLHKGHWIEIFSFLDISKDLLVCRAVSKLWLQYTHAAIKLLLKRKEGSRNRLTEFISKLPQDQQEKLALIMERRGLIRQKLELIPLRGLKFDCLYNIWMLKSPPVIIREALISVIHLITSEEEFKKKKVIEWEDCQQQMRSKKYIERLKKVKPSDLTEKQMRRFEFTKDRAIVTAEYLHRSESSVAGYLIEWGQLITAAAREMQEYEPRFRETVNVWERLTSDQENIAMIKKNLMKLSNFN